MSSETSDEVILRTDHLGSSSDPKVMLQRLAHKIDKTAETSRTKENSAPTLYQAVCVSGETNEMTGDALGLSSARIISIKSDNGDQPVNLRQVKFQIIKGAGNKTPSGWTASIARHDDPTLSPYKQNFYRTLLPWCTSINEDIAGLPIKNGDIINITKRGGAYFYDGVAERGMLGNQFGTYLNSEYTPGSNSFNKPYSGGPDSTIGAPTGDDKFSGAIVPLSMTVGRVTSRPGLRTDPVTGKKESSHGGIDIAAPIGTPLYAILDGEVLQARGTTIGGSSVGGFGAWVVIKHPKTKNNAGEEKTLYTIYGHVNSATVKQGDKVKQGQTIATVGNEGKSTGPHLHFELHTGWPKSDRTRLDPVDALGWPI